MKMDNLVLYMLPYVAEMILVSGEYLVSILIFCGPKSYIKCVR